jgi:outer membrane protein TolC
MISDTLYRSGERQRKVQTQIFWRKGDTMKTRSHAVLTTLLVMFGVIPGVAEAQSLPDLPIVNQSLTLQSALTLSSANNLAIHQGRVDLKIAQADERSASAQTKPSIATTTYGLLGDSNNIIASSPGVMPPNYLGAAPHGFADQNVILMAPLFTGGKLSGQVGSARSQSESAALTLDETKLMTQESVTDAYAQALLQAALVEVAKARLTAEDEQVRITQEKVDAGRIAPVDLLREQAEDANAQQGLLTVQTNESLAMVQLKTTLGISQASNIILIDTLDTITTATNILGSMQTAIQTAEANRPDLAAALKAVDAAKQSVQATNGAYSPQVYALGMADASSNSGVQRVGYTVGLTASIPLYDGGERQADTDASRARLERSILDAQSVRQTVDQDVATAWLNLAEATQQVVTAQTGIIAAQQAYDLATLRYNAGKSIDAERLGALSALTIAQGNLATSKASVIETKVQLSTAMGSNL